MTDDVDTLRPEVQRADSFLDSMACTADEETAVKTIRAELLRLAGVEAELAALKARIADGWLCGVSNDKCSGNFDAAIYCLPSRFRGKCVRLLVED